MTISCHKTLTTRKGSFNLFLFGVADHRLIQLTYDTTRSLYPAWSLDSNELAFFSRQGANGKDDDIYIYALASGEFKRVICDPLNHFSPAWHPSGGLVFVLSMEKKRPKLFLWDKKKLQWNQLTLNDDGDAEPAVSPDGSVPRGVDLERDRMKSLFQDLRTGPREF